MWNKYIVKAICMAKNLWWIRIVNGIAMNLSMVVRAAHSRAHTPSNIKRLKMELKLKYGYSLFFFSSSRSIHWFDVENFCRSNRRTKRWTKRKEKKGWGWRAGRRESESVLVRVACAKIVYIYEIIHKFYIFQMQIRTDVDSIRLHV